MEDRDRADAREKIRVLRAKGKKLAILSTAL